MRDLTLTRRLKRPANQRRKGGATPSSAPPPNAINRTLSGFSGIGLNSHLRRIHSGRSTPPNASPHSEVATLSHSHGLPTTSCASGPPRSGDPAATTTLNTGLTSSESRLLVSSLDRLRGDPWNDFGCRLARHQNGAPSLLSITSQRWLQNRS